MNMSLEKENEFTVQVVDPPVPVGEGVPRTGPSRPSARDCPVPLVGDQAGAHGNVPGRKDYDKAMKKEYSLGFMRDSPRTPRRSMRKLTINTSPPFACSTGSLPESGPGSNIGYVDLTWCEEEERSYKRKRVASTATPMSQSGRNDVSDRLQTKLRKLIQEMDREARNLCKLVTENPNTKREIKECSSAIRSMMSQMTTTDMLQLVDTGPLHKNDEEIIQIEERGSQTLLTRESRVEMRDAEVQTDAETPGRVISIITKQQTMGGKQL